MTLLRLLYLFDIFAVVVFAVSGALVASRKRLDVMGFMWLAVVTVVGGGTRGLAIAFGWSLPVFRISSQGATDERR